MGEPLAIDIITIFPRMLEGFVGESMLRRATEKDLVRFRVVDLRLFARDAHRTTDDRPFGGGPGMIMKPEPMFEAVESVMEPGASVILTTPQGKRFDQKMASELAGRKKRLILLCGHYEGVDERVRTALVTDEISIGDYVLTNGALAAAVIVDAVVRLLPGALGGEGAAGDESFSRGLLEYPQYTRPAVFRGMKAPDELVSGDHAKIARWRAEQSRKRTAERRPDLLAMEV